MINKISKITIDVSGNNWSIITTDHGKWVGSKISGIRQIFENNEYRKEMPHVIEQIFQTVDEINK